MPLKRCILQQQTLMTTQVLLLPTDGTLTCRPMDCMLRQIAWLKWRSKVIMIEMSYEWNVNVRVWYDFVNTKCLETLYGDRNGRCRCDVKWWSDTRTWTRRRSVWDTWALVPNVPKTLRHQHKKVRHFGTKDIVPNCLGSEVSVHRSKHMVDANVPHGKWPIRSDADDVAFRRTD